MKEFIKDNPRIRLYGDYKNFDMEVFKQDLDNILKQAQITDYSYFQNMFAGVLNRYEQLKNEILRYNNNPSMNKKFRNMNHD